MSANSSMLRPREGCVEAALILNRVLLLRGGKPSYDFEITAEHLKKAVRDFPQVTRRLEYLKVREPSGSCPGDPRSLPGARLK